MIAQFSLRLLVGMSLMWCFMPRREVTSGFFRIQMLVALGLSVLTAISWGELAVAGTDQAVAVQGNLGMIWAGLTGFFSFIGSITWTLERRSLGTRICFLVALSSLGLLLTSSLMPFENSIDSIVLRLSSELSTAILLGGMLTSMLLGHWYLTSPTMSIEPLRKATQSVGIGVSLRLTVSAIALAMVWSELGDNTVRLWLSLRWLAGIIGPAIVVVMTLRILRYRNTQSATGVLFVGVILSFIGELTATLLYQEIQQTL